MRFASLLWRIELLWLVKSAGDEASPLNLAPSLSTALDGTKGGDSAQMMATPSLPPQLNRCYVLP
jgi:hypothetical protein